MFTVKLLGLAFLCTGAIAAPSTRTVYPWPAQPTRVVSGNAVGTKYTENQAGAVWETCPPGSFQSVSGSFTVPTIKQGSGPANSSYSASAWVGIDGDTYTKSLLRTGVNFNINSDGEVSYDGWYQWYPNSVYAFDDFSISVGDVITLTVDTSSTTEGRAVIENSTTGKVVTQEITSKVALRQQNAEWVLGVNEGFDIEDNFGQYEPLCDFGTFNWYSAYASHDKYHEITPVNSTIMDIKQNDTVLTSTYLNGGDIVIQYI